MLNRVRDMLSFVLPVSKRQHEREMQELVAILNGITAELGQQATLVTNIISRFSSEQTAKTEKIKSKQENDMAFV